MKGIKNIFRVIVFGVILLILSIGVRLIKGEKVIKKVIADVPPVDSSSSSSGGSGDGGAGDS